MNKRMKALSVLGCFFIVVSAIIVAPAQTSTSHLNDEKAIRQHIDKIFQAYINRDLPTIRGTHSQQWRGFLSYSKGILRGIDAYMKDAFPTGSWASETWRIVSYKMLDYDIVFHEQTGIVCYVAELYWQDGDEKGSYKLRSIDIYGKENGEWNQIASHIGPLPGSD